MSVEWHESSPDSGLTGNRRFRLGHQNNLVLQVELCLFNRVSGEWRTFWRDAAVEDITTAETIVGLPHQRG